MLPPRYRTDPMGNLMAKASEKELPTVVTTVERFLGDAKISLRSAGPILGISHSTLRRWLDHRTVPYPWSASAVLRRIEMLDKEDQKTNLYTRLEGMDHRERVETLEQTLSDRVNG